ncbi:MAG: two-component regulator propeller domain-containing protein, partial [Bacteroidia bacterium]
MQEKFKILRCWPAFLLFFSSCRQDPVATHYFQNQPVSLPAEGQLILEDSLQPAVSVQAGAPGPLNYGPANNLPANTNVVAAGEPKSFTARQLQIIPGKDGIPLPDVKPAVDSPYTAGRPVTVPAKEPYIKDKNPHTFSGYGKLQGLKHNMVISLLNDRTGNMWFGTNGAGASKFDGKNFTHYTEKEGLANNAVMCMTEDRNGSIWFGTYGGGMCKFDGKTFTTYNVKEGLSGDVVSRILQSKDGTIWAGTNGAGVCKYDGKTFTHYGKAQGLAGDVVIAMCEDKTGAIWVSAHNAGLSKIEQGTITNFTKANGLPDDVFWSMYEDKDGFMWFGSYGHGVFKFDGKHFLNYTDSEGLAGSDVRSIFQDTRGNLWFGTTNGGVSKFDGKTFSHFGDNEGLTDFGISSMLQDRCGNIWIGTTGAGVAKYNGSCFTHLTTKEGLPHNVVRTILRDTGNVLWLGTAGGGLVRYNGRSFEWFQDKDRAVRNFVFCSLKDKKGNCWFGTKGAGVIRYDGKHFSVFTKENGLTSDDIWSMLEDRDGRLWLGTYGQGVIRYDGATFTGFSVPQGLSGTVVISMFQDRDGNYWFGTIGSGLTKYDGKRFTHFSKTEGLSDNTVNCIYQDEQGALWFGTNEGLNKYDGKTFTCYNDKNAGLSNNAILSVYTDSRQNMWVATRNGLNKLVSKTAQPVFKSYNYNDGFLGIGCNLNTMCEARNGALWIGANDRLTTYYPDGDIDDTIAPNIQLLGLDLFNEAINWSSLDHKKDSVLVLGNGVTVSKFVFEGSSAWYGLPQKLQLAYNNNYLTFNFIGITQKFPEKVKYQYKLDGMDEHWSSMTSKTEAAYGNLPPGTYSFKVKAVNSEGHQSRELNYDFVIRPPWWQTLWFRILLCTFVAGGIILFFRYRTRALRKRQKELEKLVAQRTADLELQKQLVEEKHKEITDSINYAERIQRALLASKTLLDEYLRDYFILFKPKDVVSGDFYWASKQGSSGFILVTADSTGHGVPGAIMSILNMACLKESVSRGIERPDLILNETRRLVIENLANDGSETGGKDGMDASLLSFDFKNKRMYCAAANNPVWIARDGAFIEITPDRMPVGKHEKDRQSFTLHSFDLQAGDVVYTLTDGFADQFGGPNGKKFKYKQLQKLLLDHVEKS